MSLKRTENIYVALTFDELEFVFMKNRNYVIF